MRIAESVVEVNQLQRELVLKKMENALEGLANKRIGVWGLAFKPNTDDIRESPAISICEKLLHSQVHVQAYDPIAIPNAKRFFNGNGANGNSIHFCSDAYEAAASSDALLITTEWNEFRNIDLEKIRVLMKNPVIFDPRNIFESAKVKSLGFQYFGTGRSI